ncbi:cytochrome c-type biogenesis protein CcdA [Rhodobacteraceae bacterium HTCC2150]|nr:cytochrome c-type biogenesis protein CcdA [Rhodobacteraceae bacterium HTCC2150]
MFGYEFFEAGLLVQILLAVFGGLISFLSPCVLPIVPSYLAYISGTTLADLTDGEKPNSAVMPAVFFVLGLSTVFMLLGFTASFLGQLYLQNQTILTQIAGVVIVVFGLHFIGIIRIPFLYREARVDVNTKGGSAFGAYILGLAFAFGWTPCLGPILSAILAMAADQGSTARGTMMLAFYAIGLGIPFLLSAIFLSRSMVLMTRIKRHMVLIERIMGALLVVVGLALIFGFFTRFSWWLLEAFPALQTFG